MPPTTNILLTVSASFPTGIVVATPDGTKNYQICVDNDGALKAIGPL